MGLTTNRALSPSNQNSRNFPRRVTFSNVRPVKSRAKSAGGYRPFADGQRKRTRSVRPGVADVVAACADERADDGLAVIGVDRLDVDGSGVLNADVIRVWASRERQCGNERCDSPKQAHRIFS